MTETKDGLYWRAKFRNLKVPVTNGVEKVHCDLKMELRWSMSRPHLYMIFWLQTKRPVSLRLYTLAAAKEACAKLFEEQLTPWKGRAPADWRLEDENPDTWHEDQACE